MNQKRHTLIFLTLALMIGLGAAYMAQRWTAARMADARQQASRDLTTVVVAQSEIGFGKRVDAEQIKTVDWPANAVPPGAFREPAQVIGKLSKYHILPGEPLLEARIADPDKSPLLAGLIEANKRAVSVRVDDIVGVAGFLLPGSRVDVLASKRLDNDSYETRTLLHDLKVLAVDQTAAATGEDKPVVVRAVTLEADPAQAEKLVQATREGSVQLALRNPDDRSVPAPAAILPVSDPKPRTARKARVATEQVTVIRGTHVNAVQMQR